MGIAASMKELTQDILSSAGERADKIAGLKSETRALQWEAAGMVKDFSTSRREASRQLRQQLAKSDADRKKAVKELRDEAQNMIRGFREERSKRGNHLRNELVQANRLLVENEKERKEQVGNLLGNFQSSRRETGAQLRNDLAKGKAAMKSGVREALGEAEALVRDNQSSRRAMSAQLKKGLTRDRSGRKAGVEGMQVDIRRARAEVKADLKEASDSWQGMARTVRTRKGGGKTRPEAGVKATAGITPDLKENLLSIINQHPEGIALSEVANTLGVAVVTLIKAVAALQTEGKVLKEDKLYFPTTL